MKYCSIINCNEEIYEGDMCPTCIKKFNSGKYFIHVCDECSSIVFFTRRLSKDIDRVRRVSICKGCINKPAMPPEEDDD